MKVTKACYLQLNRRDIRRLLPPRRRESHKGDYGKILLLCGSRGCTGAAKLAARAACRSGAGLVYLGVPASVYPIVAAQLDEPVVFPLPDTEDGSFSAAAAAQMQGWITRTDAVLFGPGCANTAHTRQLVQMLLQEVKGPLVLDADGINALQGHIDLVQARSGTTILTPHDGEFLRIYDGPPQDRCQETRALARKLGCIVLRKGHRTLITDGVRVYRNRAGNPGMAKGGSGDALSGILCALLGQKLAPLEAAALAAYLHGAAGDAAAKEKGEWSMLPSDLIEALPAVMR